MMGAWAYCTNEDCQRGFDRPSFAEIIARKRECPACGQISHVIDDLGTALDEKFEEIAELLIAGSQPVAVADDELPGLWQASDLSGGATDCDVAAGTIVPPPAPFVPGEAPRKTISHVNAENLDSIIAAVQEANTAQVPFQRRVHDWMLACFGAKIAADKTERNHRFLEEALELVQATGCTVGEAYQLVDYVYGRPVGDPVQEVGGITVTLAALCTAHNIDTRCAEETELARIWTEIEQIRVKQAAKPKCSPLVEVVDPVRSADSKLADTLREAIKIIDGALYCGHELNKEGESLLQAIRATYQDHHKES